jgi:hypothetical protein
MPVALTHILASWSSYYGDHQIASVSIRSLHLAGLIVGGGTAISADWQVLRAAMRGVEQRASTLARLAASHTVVVASLVLVVASGAAMTAADTETFLQSRLFFVKLALFGVLLANGLGVVFFERAAARTGRGKAWAGLTLVSATSLALWLLLLFVGTWLTVAA